MTKAPGVQPGRSIRFATSDSHRGYALMAAARGWRVSFAPVLRGRLRQWFTRSGASWSGVLVSLGVLVCLAACSPLRNGSAVEGGQGSVAGIAGSVVDGIPPSGAETSWPQWRGPHRDGRIERRLTETWPAELELAWRVEVGGGYSSPVASGGRVFVHERRSGAAEGGAAREVLRAFSEVDGRELWSESVVAPFSQNEYATSQGAGPFSSPALDLQRGLVFSYGINGVLQGRNVKTGDLDCSMVPAAPDTSKLFTGTAMSPLLLPNGNVVLHAGDDRGGRLLAFSCESESEEWSWIGDGPGYASPVVMELDGTRQIVTLTDRSLVGVEIGTGELLWRMSFPDEWNENIVTPTQFEDMVLVSGVRRGSLAVRPTLVRGTWSVSVLWERPEHTHYMSSPVLLVRPKSLGQANEPTSAAWVGLSNKRKGQLVALDVRTGKDLWHGEGRLAESASLVVAGENLLVLTVEGELIVFEWGGETDSAADGASGHSVGLVEVARYGVADASVWAHLAVTGDLLLVRSANALSAWRI